MSAKLIRDDMLESERVLSLPAEGRWLFVAITLIADDVGLFEATAFKLAKKADLKREHVDRLLPMLVDVDLVRLYQGTGMRTFGFVPRYGQRLQIRRAKHPLPPMELLAGDDDAINKIKHLYRQLTVSHGESPESTVDHRKSPSEPEPEPEPKDITPPTPTVLVPPLGAAPQAKEKKLATKAEPALDAFFLMAQGVDKQVAVDWLRVRKAPLTQTAWNAVLREAGKAGVTPAKAVQVSAENSWRGFKADWYGRQSGASPAAAATEPAWRTEQRDRMAAFAGPAAAKRPHTTATIIDMEAPNGPAQLLG